MKFACCVLRVACCLWLLSPLGISSAEVIDKVVAVVGDEVITQSEVDETFSLMYAELSSTYQGEELIQRAEKTRADIVNRLIEDRLILSEAKRQKIEVDEEEIDERIEKVKANLLPDEDLEETLRKQGIHLRKLRAHYKDQMMMKKLFDREVITKVIVKPTEAMEYYRLHVTDFTRPMELKISNILIKPNDEGDEELYERAMGILQLLEEGADFAEVAKTYSQGPNAVGGGDIGWVEPGQMMEEIDRVIFDLPAGAISDVIKTNLGYHILKIEERRPEVVRPFSEVKGEIEGSIFKQKVKERYEEWIERLKSNIYIQIK